MVSSLLRLCCAKQVDPKTKINVNDKNLASINGPPSTPALGLRPPAIVLRSLSKARAGTRNLQNLLIFSYSLKWTPKCMQSTPAPDTIARLMADFRRGDKAAADHLVEVLYPELRRLAAAKMKGERSEHTWQPTLL